MQENVKLSGLAKTHATLNLSYHGTDVRVFRTGHDLLILMLLYKFDALVKDFIYKLTRSLP